MEKSTANSAAGPAAPRSALPLRIGFGILLTAEVMLMGLAGAMKFLNPVMWRGIFEGFGYPAGMSFVVGAAELVGVALLLVPRLSSYAAMGLATIMLGALYSVLTNPNDLGPVAPAMHLVLLGVIGWARWGRRWRMG